MAVERIKKIPGATGGVDVPLITNEEFAKWLIKEFKMGWKEANDKALHYSQDRKEAALLLKDWMPAISFKGIDYLLNSNSSPSLDHISSDLRILEKYEINPSVALLSRLPVTLEKNIQALMERKRKLNEYAHLNKLGMEHEKFKSYLDNVEGGTIKDLHKKMPKIPIEAIEEFVNNTDLRDIKCRIKALEDREVDISAFTDIKELISAKLFSHFERRELKGILHEKMPSVSSKAMDELLERVYNNSRNFVPITRNVKTLEEQGVDLKKFTDADIRKLEEPASYKKATVRGEEHKKEHLEELKTGLQAEPPEAIEKFVKETRGNVITDKMNALEAWGIRLSEVGSIERFKLPIAEMVRHVERQRFMDYLGKETQIPHKDIEKVVDEVQPDVLCMRVNTLSEEGKLKGLTDANVLRMSVTELKTRIVREPPKVLAVHFRDKKGFYKLIDGFDSGMKEAFKEIGKIIEEEGMIVQSKMYEISRRHKVTLLESWVESEVNKKVNFLVDEGTLGIKSVKKEK